MSLSRRAPAFSVFCQAASMAVAVCFLNQIAKFHDGSKRFGSSPIKGGLGPLAAGFPEQRRVNYDLADVKHWLEVFIKRFFASQFKRSAIPNGPKVSAGGSLSPRGDWRMPSDAAATAWLADLARVPGDH